jgi:hypothetical protein
MNLKYQKRAVRSHHTSSTDRSEEWFRDQNPALSGVIGPFVWDVHTDEDNAVDCLQFLSANGYKANDGYHGPGVSVSAPNDAAAFIDHANRTFTKKFQLFADNDLYLSEAWWYCLPGVTRNATSSSRRSARHRKTCEPLHITSTLFYGGSCAARSAMFRCLALLPPPPHGHGMAHQDDARVSAAYLRFAEDEVRDRSPLYNELSRGVASDPEVIGFLLTLPREKRQPNLFLSAARHLFGTPVGWDQFRRGVLGNQDALRAAVLARSTQTNEPGRCAALLPVLAGLPEPLALVEVGASAGLCLLPDFYAYDYGGPILGPEAARLAPPVFRCAVNAATPIPGRLPRVIWRAGLDLKPVDLSDHGEVAWLEALVWPEQADRLARLRAAIKIAAEQKPQLLKGDLRTDLAALVRQAPQGATLVIFHTAVLAYVSSAAEREEFARSVGLLCDYWISNETPRLFPEIGGRAGREGPKGSFLLSVNGIPVAWTDPHGVSVDWIAEPPNR